ncbi:hypothetical protein U9M48_003550 [Paspalum notatum var. saurae]|uniref:Reverse transcriptase domain-containing protein n=1 Tax=Paspalum notatum var. saurae TaxID=547442 RepID=A0AAQ3PLR3_PASNO
MHSQSEQEQARWNQIMENFYLLFARVNDIGVHQNQLEAKLDLTTRAMDHYSAEQQSMAQEVRATSRAVAKLTQASHSKEIQSDTSSESSAEILDQPFDNAVFAKSSGKDSRRSQGHKFHQLPYQALPKLHFPSFDGTNPKIWKEKCLDYFKIFNITEQMWVTAASIHFEDKVAKWLSAYKQQKSLGTWDEFCKAVEDQFGADDYRTALSELLALKQSSSIEEYTSTFEALRFEICLHNSNYDELFFVSKYIAGLHDEVRVAVEAQIPPTVPQAALIAKIQQRILDRNKLKQTKYYGNSKQGATSSSKPVVPPTNLRRERQLREYHRTNVEDTLAEEFYQLSLNALSTVDKSRCIKLRALVGNKAGLCCTPTTAKQVKLPSGEILKTSSQVTDLSWWCQGHTLVTSFQVLDMAPYDILGYDWLSAHSPMICDWENRTIEFQYKNQSILLKGVPSTSVQLAAITPEQLWKATKGNDIWAFAVVEIPPVTHVSDVPPAVQSLLSQFQDVFQEPTTLPPARSYDHAIPLIPGVVPVNSRPYRYSPLYKSEIEKQVKQLLQAGLITHSHSPFASPVLLVKKKDGTWRFCVDYRKLNDLTIKNKFPLPVIEEILDELAGAHYFTKLDMRSGYHQVRMLEQDEYKTAFKTHHGHYQFKVMPFGLTNAPATFQCIMNEVLQPFLRKFVLVFLDNILIYSPTWDQHLTHISQVLQTLREHKLYLKPSKCSFAQTSVEYLGHIISGQGVATDPSKTTAMQRWPTPTSVTELRGFLGLTNYYRRFVKNYGIIAKPLTQLLHKNQFQWSQEADQAFHNLKEALTHTPVLALPYFTEPFTIETDACGDGIGAVLMQQGRPIAFLSKALSVKHLALSIYEKEFLAIILAVEKW